MNPRLSMNRDVWICGLLSLILPFILFSYSFAQESAKMKTVQDIEDAGYKLSIKDHLIALNANDSSLKMILEDIGKED